jgi:hypothetical protein
VRQEAEHDPAGHISAHHDIWIVVNQEDGQPGDQHARHAVKHAAVHGDPLEKLRQAETHDEVGARQHDEELVRGELVCGNAR